MNFKIRNILIFVAIAAIFILVYFFFIRSSPSQPTLVSSAPVSTSPTAGGSSAVIPVGSPASTQNFLSLLLNVKTIKLDDSIFSDPAFASLHDSSIILIPDTTVGRPNPFAQFGNDVTPSSATAPAAPSTPTIPATPKP